MPPGGRRFLMEDSKSIQNGKMRKLVLKKNTVRVLDGKEAKAVVGGMMVNHEGSCTCKCKTILSTDCCK
jgi:hypothetical protein